MSGLVAVFSRDSAIDPGIARTMLRAMPRRGEPRAAVWQDGDAVLGVSRREWELGRDFSGPVHLVEENGVVVAADASLYYRDDLRRRLATLDVTAGGDSASHLILAAYRAWGEDCARHLEGDFAFILWDRSRRQGLCARDFAGRRSLYYAQCGGSLVVASSIGAVLAHPACPSDLNATAVGATAAGLLWSAGSDSCYDAVNVLPVAHMLQWNHGRLAGPTRFWTPHVRGSAPVTSFDDAAEELRGLLQRATRERMATTGVTTVWLSGGWDSTAVFGAGQAGLRAAGGGARGQRLLPVSISYPEGDPGREDELITDVAGFWQTPIHWLDIANIPLLDGLEQRAALTDEPPAHLYELWNRALARGTRACGSRVALDGGGGDQLFQVSDIYLSDLLRRGRLLQLADELRVKRSRGLRHLFGSTVEPLLPEVLARQAGRLSGSGGRHYLERVLPSWIRSEFAGSHELVERDRAVLPPRMVWSRADAETRHFLTAPYWAFAGSYISGALIEEEVETRSPLLDQRIVEFALRRPIEERASGRETKSLLRRAVRGTLPDHVLAPRPYRTGITIGYSRREMRSHFPALFEGLFSRRLMLAELGAVDPKALELAVSKYLKGDESERMPLFHTLNTELWLRGRLGLSGAETGLASLAEPAAAVV